MNEVFRLFRRGRQGRHAEKHLKADGNHFFLRVEVIQTEKADVENNLIRLNRRDYTSHTEEYNYISHAQHLSTPCTIEYMFLPSSARYMNELLAIKKLQAHQQSFQLQPYKKDQLLHISILSRVLLIKEAKNLYCE